MATELSPEARAAIEARLAKPTSAFDGIQLRADIRLLLTALAQVEQIDNGNPFIFCDFVSDRRGCVRGAGHNGPHALNLPPHPMSPVALQAAKEER